MTNGVDEDIDPIMSFLGDIEKHLKKPKRQQSTQQPTQQPQRMKNEIKPRPQPDGHVKAVQEAQRLADERSFFERMIREKMVYAQQPVQPGPGMLPANILGRQYIDQGRGVPVGLPLNQLPLEAQTMVLGRLPQHQLQRVDPLLAQQYLAALKMSGGQ